MSRQFNNAFSSAFETASPISSTTGISFGGTHAARNVAFGTASSRITLNLEEDLNIDILRDNLKIYHNF